jgi:hypothetical protein
LFKGQFDLKKKGYMKKLLIGLAAFSFTLVCVFVFNAQMAIPHHFEVESEELIQAAPEQVYKIISTFSDWQKWSPWKQMDPSAEDSVSTVDAIRVGDIYNWKSQKLGSGSLLVEELTKNSQIKFKMTSARLRSNAHASFLLQDDHGKTTLKWKIYGTRGFLDKMFWNYSDVENQINDITFHGLKNIKILSEKKGGL